MLALMLFLYVCETKLLLLIKMVFKFPPFNTFENKFFKNKDIIKDVNFPNNCHYYFSTKDTVHVYKINYIEGSALRVEVKNDYLDSKNNLSLAIDWDITPSIVNRNIPSFYVYFFYKCDIIDCGSSPNGFLRWKVSDL